MEFLDDLPRLALVADERLLDVVHHGLAAPSRHRGHVPVCHDIAPVECDIPEDPVLLVH